MAEDTYYLIDFENVGLKGLEGAEKLTLRDRVHLFSTRNAPKINTATLANFNGTNLLVHEVPAKSQSLDMHLVSYLGYLLGSCKPLPKIVILSNDTDYDDIVQFWKTELNVDVKRRDSFQAPEPKPAPKQSAAKADVKPAPAQKEKAPAKPAEAGKGKTAEKPAAQKEKAAAKTAETPAPAPKDKPNASEGETGKSKTEAKPAAPAKEKTPKAADAAKSKAKTVEPQDKTAVNNAVMKALSAAKFDNEIVGYAASQVTKLFSEKNGKQLIYRSIISKYGQEHGLEIYRTIKKLL